MGIGICLAAGLLVLISPGSAAAQPRGDFRVWVEQRQERFGPFGVTRYWEGSRLHAEGLFYPVNAGAWNFLADASERGQELRFQGNDIPTAAGRLFLQLGDFVQHDPREDPLRPEFDQDVWIRGASVSLRGETVNYGLRAGTLTERRGLFGWGRAPVFANLVGATVGGSYREHGLWKLDWDRQEATEGRQGQHLARLFFGSQPVEGWSWMGQGRLSRVEDGVWGTSLIGGGRFQKSNLYAAGHLRRISPGFQGLGLYRDAHANEWGTRVEVSYRSPQHVLVGSSMDWAHDLAPRPGLSRPETRLTTRFFVSTPLTGPLSYRGDVGFRNRSTEDPDSLFVDQKAMLWSSALSLDTGVGQADVDVRRSLYRDPTALQGDWLENRYGASYLHRLSRRLRVDLRGWLARRDFLDGAWASTERKLETQWYWEPGSTRRGWVRLGRLFQDASDAGFARDQWELSLGWTQPLPWNLSLDLETTHFVRAGAFEADRARYSLRFTRRFIFGEGGLRRNEDLPEFGTIRGRVFTDLNHNGVMDPGEPGIPGQVLKLGSGPETTTGPDGGYEFKDAVTVIEWITFDHARLPTRYLTPDETRFRVELAPGEERVLHVPVKLAASVGGRVVLGFEDHAEGVPDVLIRVVGTHHDVFTDREGRFWIPGLEPGEITLELIEWSIPRDALMPESAIRKVILRGGRPMNAGVFVLRPRDKKVIQVFRPGTSND